MIGSLQGVVAAIGEDTALIEVGGVGYVVQAGARTLGRLSVGATVRLAVETHVREDAIRLFGFDSEEERAWFAYLQTIPGVGAKVSLGILDAMPVDVLADAIALQDKAAFARANGVGPKLAQRIVTELKDKAAGMALGVAAKVAALPANAGAGGDLVNDAVSALVNLGYRRAEAYGAVSKALAASAARPGLNDLIVNGLRELSQ